MQRQVANLRENIQIVNLKIVRVHLKNMTTIEYQISLISIEC